MVQLPIVGINVIRVRPSIEIQLGFELKRGAVFFLMLLGSLCILSAAGGDWYQYRGPNRDGISRETGLVRGWGEAGPKEVWRVPVGPAFSGISVVGNRVYNMGSDDTSEYAFALDAQTGKEVWRVPVGDLFKDNFGDGPRSTPAIHGDLVYVLGSMGRLMALQTAAGDKIWEVDFRKELESALPGHAFCTSPLVLDNQLIVETAGSDARAVSSFDKNTGKLNWSSKEDKLAYSSPQTMDFNGVRQLVFLTRSQLFALDIQGKELWSTPSFVPPVHTSPAMPLFVAPDLIFISASYNGGAKVVRMKREGQSVAVETVWENRRVMRNHFNTSVAQDHYVFGFDKAMFKCIDARNGEQQWVQRGLGKGSLIGADGMLIVLSERGKLHLVEADLTAYKELASHQVLTGRCWTQPSLAAGRLYVRNQKEMVCLDLQER